MVSEVRGAVVFSVTYIGDLVQATLTFDIIARSFGGPLTVVAAPAAAPLLFSDPRVGRVVLVRSSHPLLWRVEVARRVLGAQRRGAALVNVEVYPPRWRFLQLLCRLLGLECRSLDLPALLEDERRSQRGQLPGLSHRSGHYARAVGLSELEAPPLKLFIDPSAAKSVGERVRGLGWLEEALLVVVHPGASETRRRAPETLFSVFLRRLAARSPVGVIFVGGDSERSLCARVASGLPNNFALANWAGELSLRELAAVLQVCGLFVGNDSGPLKIAEAVAARTLSLWGPTAPGFAGPRGAGHMALRFDSSDDEIDRAALELLRNLAPKWL